MKLNLKPRPTSTLSRPRLLFIFALLIIFGTIWLAAKTIGGPAVGDVYRPSNGISESPQTYIQIDGKRVVFNYPEEYTLDPAGKDQPNVLEYYTFKKRPGDRPGSLTLAISVYKLNGTKLEEDGAFKIRKQQPDMYQERLSSINNRPFIIFKKKDGNEVTAFTRNGELTASIAMAGSLASNNQSEAEFTAILNSWQWK